MRKNKIINWTKWGAIFTALGVMVTVVGEISTKTETKQEQNSQQDKEGPKINSLQFESREQDSNNSTSSKPSINNDNQQNIAKPIIETIEKYHGKGTACKGDSMRAWNEAYQRAKNDLIVNIRDSLLVNTAIVDYSQSTKPILTQNGWEATVVIFVKK